MLEKIRICLCHPKYIAMYYKEKPSKIVTLILTFFLAFTGILLLSESKKDIFNNVDNEDIIQAIVIGEDSNITFDTATNKLEGNQAIYKSNYYNVYFLPQDKISLNENDSKTSIVFESEKVLIYYSGLLLYTGDYQSGYLDSFSLAEVGRGEVKNTFAFSEFLTVILNDANDIFVGVSIAIYLMTMITYYFGIVLTLFLFTMLSNPSIGKGVRFKLCCLDSLIFILVFAFQVLFDIPWLIFVGAALPIIYSNVTFMHIVRKVN